MRTLCCGNGLLISFLILNWLSILGYVRYAQRLLREPPKVVEDSSEDIVDAKLVFANTTFGFKLFAELTKPDIDKNIFISPSSIATALTMTYNGTDGETKKAMTKALELKGMRLEEVNKANAELMAMLENADQCVQLEIANSLWADRKIEFKSDFMKRNKDFYGAEITNLDFNEPDAISRINDWISKKTNGKIDEMVNEIDRDAILFLINAIYFKGTWTLAFDKKQTKDRTFILLDGTEKEHPTMVAQSKRFMYYQAEDFQSVSIPYGSERISMYLFLPGMDSSLEEFCNGLNAENWEKWMSQFQKKEIVVVLPRFKLEYEVKLNDALKALGMGIAFGPGANFKNMCSGKAFIDWVKHKSLVEVNEEGTEASAATVMKMKRGARPTTIVFNRPFFFAIGDNETGTMLFMGVVVEPQ